MTNAPDIDMRHEARGARHSPLHVGGARAYKKSIVALSAMQRGLMDESLHTT